MKKNKLTSLKYKNKLIKSLLVPTIAILSTASITTIATSCGKNQVNYNYTVTSGSTLLSGAAGKAGEDSKKWELIREDDEIITNGVNWSIEKQGNTDIAYISIRNGKVSWTNKIQKNTYKFVVVAQYEGKQYKSSEITLNINELNYEVVGGTEYLQIEENNSDRDNKYWKLTIAGETIDNGVTYSLESTSSEELPNSLAISDTGLISWTEIKAGDYKFRVKVEYKEDGEQHVCYSKEITYIVISQDFYLYLDGGSLELNGYVSISSSDGQEWKLHTKNNVISPDYNELTWEIEVNSSKLDGVLAIENGHVTWSNFNKEGTYQFRVKCYSKTHLRWATSQMITLKINNKPAPSDNKMIGFKGNKISYYNKFSESNVDIYLEKKEDGSGNVEYLATKPVEAAIYQGESNKDCIDYTPIFNFPVNADDRYTSDRIMYKVVYDDEGPTYEKTGIYVNGGNSTEWYSVDELPLRYTATSPSYGKAKIVVTFECDSNVSLTIPINTWNTPSVGTPGSFELPSDISTDTPAVINYDKILNVYECFLEAQDLSEAKNRFAKFNIIYTYNYGIYSQDKFLINDIKEKIKNVNVVNVEIQFEECYPEVLGTKLATAFVKYSIFLEIEFNDINPDATRNDLFSLCDYDESQSYVIGKCNFIWYIR